MDAKTVIEHLGLQPLEPEGGFFAQTYKSAEKTTIRGQARSLMTATYYLLTRTSFSAFHRLSSTEIYHYYAGARAEVLILSETELKRCVLGPRLAEGDVAQLVIPPNTWQACRILTNEKEDWCLVGNTVSPGFEFEDFELGSRGTLLRTHPQHAEIITQLTRN